MHQYDKPYIKTHKNGTIIAGIGITRHKLKQQYHFSINLLYFTRWSSPAILATLNKPKKVSSMNLVIICLTSGKVLINQLNYINETQ